MLSHGANATPFGQFLRCRPAGCPTARCRTGDQTRQCALRWCVRVSGSVNGLCYSVDTGSSILTVASLIFKMSTDLQWLLIRKWNSFQHKGGNGPTFSREKVSATFTSITDLRGEMRMAGRENATRVERGGRERTA